MKKPVMYPHTFSGLPAVQVESELRDFLRLAGHRQISSYLEIGVGRGDTFHAVTSCMPVGSRAMAVDLPGAAWGLGNSTYYLERALDDLKERYKAQVIYGASSDPGIIEIVANSGPFDLVLIDGDHTIEGVTRDWINYGPLGRIVAFHDIADPMRLNDHGERIDVPLLWRALKARRPYLEFIGRNSTMGIGVLLPPEEK